MNKLRNGLTNTAYTENGALSNKSTTDNVLDLFYHAPARRGQDNTTLFASAYAQDPALALLCAFYVRDVRGGQGERNTFKQILAYLADSAPDVFIAIMVHIPEYGRWDDLTAFASHGNVGRAVVDFISAQLEKDIDSKAPSLLAKWLPSENASSKTTRARARYLCGMLGLTVREYRVMLSDLRKRINIVERLMSAKQFDQINYAQVPSRASMIYRKAFFKRDENRYREFLSKVEKGEATINAGTLYPYDLVSKYTNGSVGYANKTPTLDRTVEAQWKALPDYCNGRTYLTVCDTSGSMFQRANSKSSVLAIDVAISLAIYSAERNKGAFANMWIEFNSTARAHELTGKSLRDNVATLAKAEWGGSTNLQSAMDLILNTAMRHKVPAEDMPSAVVIVSDMQFNSAVHGTNYDTIKAKYRASGYEMPMVVFWNVCSRVNEAPALADDKNTYLVGGCSPSIFTTVLSGKSTTPRELMLKKLQSDRYTRVNITVKELFNNG